MRTIIEGCDGTGKSTLALILAKKYKCDIVHMTAWSPKNFMSYMNRLKNKNIIFDRFFISEVIYSKVFNRDTKIHSLSIRLLLFFCNILKCQIYILTDENDIIIKRLKERNDESNAILLNIMNLNKEYIDFALKYNIKILRTEEINEII